MESVRCSILGTMAARYQDFDTEIGGHKIAAGVSYSNIVYFPN